MGALPIVTRSASLFEQIYYSTVQPTIAQPGATGPWRPPQWSSESPAFVMTATDPITRESNAYFFDAVIRLEHEQQTVITRNPVQSGAPVTDHAYTIPPRLTIEIAMSDAMQSYKLGQFATGPSRSVSAYQTLIAIQQRCQPLQISTRLNTYSNMLIAEVRVEDDHETKFGLKAIVTFIGILTATVQLQLPTASGAAQGSLLPQTTVQSLIGQVQPSSVPSSILTQNSIANAANLGVDLTGVPSVPGAGSWSSSSVGTLNNVLSGLP